MVSGCGNGDAESLALFCEFPDRGERLCAELFGDGFRGFGVYIVNSHKFRVCGFTVNFRMVSAEHADTDDTDFDFAGWIAEHGTPSG